MRDPLIAIDVDYKDYKLWEEWLGANAVEHTHNSTTKPGYWCKYLRFTINNVNFEIYGPYITDGDKQ